MNKSKVTNKRCRRRINQIETLKAYRERIMKLPIQAFEQLNDSFLSCYDVYNTIDDHTICNSSMLKSNAIQLMIVARGLGINVKGVTSARKSNKKYLCEKLLGEDRSKCKIIYVGKFNYFTNKQPHKLFSIQICDKRYEKD